MTSLLDVNFTNKNDKRSANIWTLESGLSIDTLRGNDKIIASSSEEGTINPLYGINNAGNIKTSAGDDHLTVIATATGDGDTGGSVYGINNTGQIMTGSGNDELVSITNGIGAHLNGGQVYGIYNEASAIIQMGKGADHITAISKTTIGKSTLESSVTYGLYNGKDSIIKMGRGDDKITAIAENNSDGGDAYGIYNEGTIKMGGDNNTIIGTAKATNGSAYGLFFTKETEDSLGKIVMGQGIDKIIGTANLDPNSEETTGAAIGLSLSNTLIKMKSGDDTITGSVEINSDTDSEAYGINIFDVGSSIGMQNGNDLLIGVATVLGAASKVWGIVNNGAITFGRGSDNIHASARTDQGETYGLFNQGETSMINMGRDDDFITATATTATAGSNPDIYGMLNEGQIEMGNGQNHIKSMATGNGDQLVYGIYNKGNIQFGDSNDSLTAIGSVSNENYVNEVYGIINFGHIDMGKGVNIIESTGAANLTTEEVDYLYGIDNNDGSITMSGSSNTLTGTASVNSEDLDEAIGVKNGGHIEMIGTSDNTLTGSVTGGGSSQKGITNRSRSTINMGSGADKIIGSIEGSGDAISNRGTINMGEGSDIVDGLSGGFSGDGVINFGDDNDTLKGFGRGTFNGDSGDEDLILLGEGIYMVNTTTITSNNIVMHISGFEKVGGTSQNSDILDISSLTQEININALGIITS